MTEPLDPKSLFFKTPEKQEGVYQEGSIIVVRDGPCGLERKLGAFEALIANTAYAQGAASRDARIDELTQGSKFYANQWEIAKAEVEALQRDKAILTSGIIERNKTIEELKAEVERLKWKLRGAGISIR